MVLSSQRRICLWNEQQAAVLDIVRLPHRLISDQFHVPFNLLVHIWFLFFDCRPGFLQIVDRRSEFRPTRADPCGFSSSPRPSSGLVHGWGLVHLTAVKIAHKFLCFTVVLFFVLRRLGAGQMSPHFLWATNRKNPPHPGMNDMALGWFSRRRSGSAFPINISITLLAMKSADAASSG